MSDDSTEESADRCCANCGVKEIDDIKLKDCGGCDLAQYCGDECQQNHLEDHKATCKERAAELRDELLFRQPESTHWGDCPICFLPMPIEENKSRINSCCGKVICNGCSFANKKREIEARVKHNCPFCRKPLPGNDKVIKKNHEKRVEANDPNALQQMGKMRYDEGDYDTAFEYMKRAADLGDTQSHCNLSIMYREGDGVEKDENMEMYHLEEAAIGGEPDARYILGCYEGRCERFDRTVKHWIIAAHLGHNKSIQALKACYKEGLVSKDDLAVALRAHHAAVIATKSPQREEAAKYGTN